MSTFKNKTKVWRAAALAAAIIVASWPSAAESQGTSGKPVKERYRVWGVEDPTSWLKHKICLMPASKLKFIDAGTALRSSMKRAFRGGNMNPNQFVDDVARLTGYKAEEISGGEGFACYVYFSFLPAVNDFLVSEGAARFAGDNDEPSLVRERVEASTAFTGGLIADEGVFDAKAAFQKARENGYRFEEGDFAAFRNYVFLPGFLEFVENSAAESLREAPAGP